MEYLKEEDIVLINELTIKRHGGNFVGPFNLLKSESLSYLIEAVGGEVFGQAMYPGIEDKAAFYMYSIVSNHVFQDGNKRTGLEAALLFLKLNGYRLKSNLNKVTSEAKVIPEAVATTNEILFNFTIEMASGKLSLEESALWFAGNVEEK